MDTTNLKFFHALLNAPSPSGYESPAQKVVAAYLKKYADKVETDIIGNVIALKKGSGKHKVMIIGHADEIGLIINHIDDRGYIYVKTLGGFDLNLLPGLRVNVHHSDQIVRGIIGKKPIHMMRGTDDPPKLKIEDMWIDIGAKSKDDALTKIALGDVITYNSQIEMLNDDLIVTKATDNKAGVYVAAAVMRELAQRTIKANYYAVSSVGEETTMRGARTSSFRIEPDIAIAVDVTFTSDIPDADKRIYGDVALGKGPVLTLGSAMHPKILSLIQDTANDLEIPYQVEIAPAGTGTDADAIHSQRTGSATAVLSIPNRYMHSPNEVIAISDLDNAVKLLAAFIQKLDGKINLLRI